MYWANVSERQASTPPLAVSTVVFTLRSPAGDGAGLGRGVGADAAGSPPSVGESAERGAGPRLWIPLVRRRREPYLNQWALPGGPLRGDTSLRTAAANNLLQTTGLAPTLLEQLYTFGGTDRGEGARTVSVVYWALVRFAESDLDLMRDPDVAWFPADDPEVLAGLAFDHRRIVEYALARLRAKVEYADVAHRLLGERFTLAQLRGVYEAVLGQALDPANFRRTVLARGGIEDSGEVLTGVRNRPPRLYTAISQRDPSGIPDPEGDPS
ncbi:NUDIX hydrolase [Galactobacter caseinivorans]|uniref:NUDIX hydrolase n=1 Tax=Galactobacter caseinivorans TaxID=2676123 RepID=A0A496PJD4_9MICC|nr:NUDIX domain-containing protein [Galactobacter caseinivorans]RKW70613.1 NUDIX hydrolase [Galactobacter caseinivorans]